MRCSTPSWWAAAAGESRPRIRMRSFEILEIREHGLDRVADPIVIGDQIEPRNSAVRQCGRELCRQEWRVSDRSCSLAGRSLPLDACTIDIESSTVTDCGPAACMSCSVRPRHGKMNECLPTSKCERFNLVPICTARSRRAPWPGGIARDRAALRQDCRPDRSAPWIFHR